MGNTPNTTGTISGDLAKFSGTKVAFLPALRQGLLQALLFAGVVLVILQLLAAVAYGIGRLWKASNPSWEFALQDAWLWHANGQTVLLVAGVLAASGLAVMSVFGLAYIGGWPRLESGERSGAGLKQAMAPDLAVGNASLSANSDDSAAPKWRYKLTLVSANESLLEVFANDLAMVDRAGCTLRDGFPELVVTKYSTDGDPPEVFLNGPARAIPVQRG